MEVNIENIDIEQLRYDLMDYFGTAMASGFPIAIINLSDVEKASKEQLVKIAIENGYDLNNYIIKTYK